jgi:hypothetical protein
MATFHSLELWSGYAMAFVKLVTTRNVLLTIALAVSHIFRQWGREFLALFRVRETQFFGAL